MTILLSKVSRHEWVNGGANILSKPVFETCFSQEVNQVCVLKNTSLSIFRISEHTTNVRHICQMTFELL